MDWLSEPFSHAFMQRAAVAGILAAVTTSLVGTWVVLRGLTFMGDALRDALDPRIPDPPQRKPAVGAPSPSSDRVTARANSPPEPCWRCATSR